MGKKYFEYLKQLICKKLLKLTQKVTQATFTLTQETVKRRVIRESSLGIEELLEGFWGYMIGNMIAVFFVLCQILGEMQHGQIRFMQIINSSYFVW